MIPSLPNINKQSFETSGAEDSAGNRYFSLEQIITDCILFNDGKPLFRPNDDEVTTYNVDDNKSYVKHIDGHLVELEPYRTITGHKKAYLIQSTLTDIGHKSFRSNSPSFPADTGPERRQLNNLPKMNGVTRSRKIHENSSLPDGHRFRLLPIRVKDGQIFDHWTGSRNIQKAREVHSPGDFGYSIFDVFKNCHPIPAEDGYYVFVFSFGYMIGEGAIDDSAYICYSAKVA